MSSVLSKTSKLHALAAELQKKHPDDSRAVACRGSRLGRQPVAGFLALWLRALDDINKQCKAMEAEYETLNTLQTKGELKGFGPCLGQRWVFSHELSWRENLLSLKLVDQPRKH